MYITDIKMSSRASEELEEPRQAAKGLDVLQLRGPAVTVRLLQILRAESFRLKFDAPKCSNHEIEEQVLNGNGESI